MDHVAIDLGGKESQICVRAADGTILEERRVATAGLKQYFASRGPSVVILETCAEAFTVAEQARQAGCEVKVVPASLARSLGVGSRGMKSDVRDARNLSEASCRMSRLPSVHVPTAASRERKSLCGMREALVGARTQLINTVRGWMRGQGIGTVKRGGTETYTHRLRKHYEARRGPTGRSLPGYVERQLLVIETLTAQIEEADRELEELAQADPVCQLLMTMPGVGPVTAVRFIAAVDDPHRFSDAHSLESYLGLTPGEDSSSERKRITSITKAGPKAVRWTLVQAAWVARRWRQSDPMIQWALALEQRRERAVGVVALARKMAGILWAMWRRNEAYDPRRGAAAATHVAAAPTAAA